MRKTLFVVLSMALTLSSCKKEKPAGLLAADNWYYLEASINESEPESKTTIDDGSFGKEIVWNEGDEIAVYTYSSEKLVFVQDGESGLTTTRFKYNGTPDFKGDDVYVALYPESMVSGKAGELKMTWPTVQTIRYGAPMNVDIPMYAEGEISGHELDAANFRCLGGIICLELSVPETGNEGENTGGYLRSIEISADQILSGDFTLTEYAGMKKLVFGENSRKMISVIFEGAPGEENKGIFMVPGQKYMANIMLPVSPADGFKNFKMVFRDDNNTLLYTVQANKPIHVSRKTVTPIKLSFNYLHRPGLTYSDPAGTIGILDGRRAMVVDIDGYKFAMAMENAGATAENVMGTAVSMPYRRKKEILEQIGLKDGWRIPTAYEWIQIGKKNENLIPEHSSDTDSKIKRFNLYIGDSEQRMPLYVNTEYGKHNYAVFDDTYYLDAYLSSEGFMEFELNNRTAPDVFIRPVHDLPHFPPKSGKHILTADDQVGTVGYISETDPYEAVMMTLCGRKVAVSKTNVGAENEFDFGSTISITNEKWQNTNLENGWCIPTAEEINEMLGVTNTDYRVKISEDKKSASISFPSGDLTFPLRLISQYSVQMIAAQCPVYAGAFIGWYSGTPMDPFESIRYDDNPSFCEFHVRPVYEFEHITASSPVGTRGRYNDQECVVAEFDGEKKLVSINCAYYKNMNYCFLDKNVFHDMQYYPDTFVDKWGKGWRVMNESELRHMVNHMTNDIMQGKASTYESHDDRYYWQIGDYQLRFDTWGRKYYNTAENTDRLYIASPYWYYDYNKEIRVVQGLEIEKDSNHPSELKMSSLPLEKKGTASYYSYAYQVFLVHDMPQE